MDDIYVARFWSRVDKRGPSDCWLWTAARNERGYGTVWNGFKVVRAHRIAWTLAHGEIPSGMYICHRCDQPSCCNPAHLFTGTHADNMRDMAAKGRARTRRGAQHRRSRITENQAREIIALLSQNSLTLDQIGCLYGVSLSAIWCIKHGKTWRHVQR